MNEKEKQEKSFYESWYYIFGWFLTACFGFIYAYVRNFQDFANGWVMGSLMSLVTLFILGGVAEFNKAYIKKYGKRII